MSRDLPQRALAKHLGISPILHDLDQEVRLPLNDASAYNDLAWLLIDRLDKSQRERVS